MSARRLAGLGVTTVAGAVALFAWLHLAPPSGWLDWRTRTISQYALLDNGWIFDTATLILAAGSAAIRPVNRGTRRARWRRGTATNVTVQERHPKAFGLLAIGTERAGLRAVPIEGIRGGADLR